MTYGGSTLRSRVPGVCDRDAMSIQKIIIKKSISYVKQNKRDRQGVTSLLAEGYRPDPTRHRPSAARSAWPKSGNWENGAPRTSGNLLNLGSLLGIGNQIGVVKGFLGEK